VRACHRISFRLSHQKLVHSPLLEQPRLLAVPPLSDMLKFSGLLHVRQVKQPRSAALFGSGAHSTACWEVPRVSAGCPQVPGHVSRNTIGSTSAVGSLSGQFPVQLPFCSKHQTVGSSIHRVSPHRSWGDLGQCPVRGAGWASLSLLLFHIKVPVIPARLTPAMIAWAPWGSTVAPP